MTDEILEKCAERRKLKTAKLNDDDSNKKYRDANRLVKEEIRKARGEFLHEKCEQIEKALKETNLKLRKVFSES